MIYFEANVTTTIPNPSYSMNSNNKYPKSNSIAGLPTNSHSGMDYPQPEYTQNQIHQQHQALPHQQLPHQQSHQFPHQQPHQQSNQHSHQQPHQQYRQQGEYNSKFTPQDIQVLKQLLITGEKHKWKQITKEINYQAASRKNMVSDQSGFGCSSDDSSTSNSYGGGSNPGKLKNVSPTFVIKQYQALLGLPNNSMYFGLVGSSLPYVAGSNGWDDIPNVSGMYDSISDTQNDVE